VGGFVKGFDTLLLRISTDYRKFPWSRPRLPLKQLYAVHKVVKEQKGGAGFSQPCFKKSRVVKCELELGLSDLTAAQVGDRAFPKAGLDSMLRDVIRGTVARSNVKQGQGTVGL
jgi:hypothetical protein